MATLYELSGQYLAAVAALEADPDLPMDAIADTLDGLQGEIKEKGTNVAAYIRNLESTAEAVKEAEAGMARRRKAMEARAEYLRIYLHRNMKECGISKIECPHFTVSVHDNPPSVEVFSQQMLPAEYIKAKLVESVDRVSLAKDLKGGKEVPGARLVRGERVVIK